MLCFPFKSVIFVSSKQKSVKKLKIQYLLKYQWLN